jgi:hypothetical protein
MSSLESRFASIEQLALSALRNVDPNNGCIHDYRNILIPVDRALRSINAVYIAINRAETELRETINRQ